METFDQHIHIFDIIHLARKKFLGNPSHWLVPNIAAVADPEPPSGVDDTLQKEPTGGDGEKFKVVQEGLKYPE